MADTDRSRYVAVMRRAHVAEVRVGLITLPADEAHHVRNVLRLTVDDEIELFDAIGRRATARLSRVEADSVEAVVSNVEDAWRAVGQITIASAVPKADRADWLVEKLSEIGVARWVPLRTARSVVHPEGRSKMDRWQRIAIEAAKQSRRAGVMAIDSLAVLDAVVESVDPASAAVLSTRGDVRPLSELPVRTLFIGPEGGWTDEELSLFASRGIMPATLGPTILRIETAAIVGAGILATRRGE